MPYFEEFFSETLTFFSSSGLTYHDPQSCYQKKNEFCHIVVRFQQDITELAFIHFFPSKFELLLDNLFYFGILLTLQLWAIINVFSDTHIRYLMTRYLCSSLAKGSLDIYLNTINILHSI